eukprot:117694_1
MEVVISLAQCQNSRDNRISRRKCVIERLCAEVVRHGINAKRGLLDAHYSKPAGEHESTPSIIPAIVSNERRQNQRKENHKRKVKRVLNANDWIAFEILDIDTPNTSVILFQK